MRLLKSLWFRFAALGLLGLLLVLSFTYWRRTAAGPPGLTPLAQDPLIQVYFNHSQTASYTEPYRHQTRPGDDLEQLVVDAIASAQSSIEVAVHELTLPRIAQALADRHRAGVQVRVVVENTYSRPLSSYSRQEVEQWAERERKKYREFVQLVDQNQDSQLSPAEITERDAIVILRTAQVPLLDDTADGSKGSDLMHHKFLIIDRQRVIVGSSNLSTSDVHGDFSAPASQGNANHLLKISSPALAEIFAEEFALLWGNGPGSQTSRFGRQKPYRPARKLTLAPDSTVTVQFSPTSSRLTWEQSVNGLIGRSLQTAADTIDLALFVFSDQPLSNALEQLHQRGIQVRALIDPGFAYRDYSEALDMMGVALPNKRCRYEADNQPWKTPLQTVGVPALPDGDLLHHKFGVVDRRLVITGSQNWSAAANEGNDENLLVIDNTTVAAHFQREFDRLYQGAILGVPTQVQQRIQQQQRRCRN